MNTSTVIHDLDQKLAFIEELNTFKSIERIMSLPNLDRNESDAEHSWHLAMFVMVFASSYPILSMTKCLQLALIHDLPELYAWDCPPRTDTTHKHLKEQQAIEKILSLLPDDTKSVFHVLFEEYEMKSSPEARFVYQLDKVIPYITCYLCRWLHLQQGKLTYNQLVPIARSKVTSEFWFDIILEKYIDLCKTTWCFYQENS